MKKYIVSERNFALNDIVPIKVYDSYELFQKGLIKHFSKKVMETKEDESNIKDGMIINFSFKINLAEADED